MFLVLLVCIFFFKQKTAYEMRISDWSSDVCSSDLIEEEHHPRLVRIADLRKLLEEFRQQPEQEGGVEGRRQDQLVGSQDVDRPAPVAVAAQEVRQRQLRLTEEGLGTLLVQGQQATLDRAHRSTADVAVDRKSTRLNSSH